jgi:magnesium transporter
VAADLARHVRDHDLPAIDAWLGQHTPRDVADSLARLAPDERAIAFRLLTKQRALEVFEALDPAFQHELVDALRDDRVRQIFAEMDPDDRVRLVDEMPANVARRLLAGLSRRERRLTARLLGYPDDSAGRMMSPETVSLRATMSAAEALSKVRRTGRRAETLYVLPVTDEQRRLLGVLGLQELVLADPSAVVGKLMSREFQFARAEDDQELAVRLIAEADLLALPVVDREDRLLGIITIDDAIGVLEEEETEDAALAGGSVPLRRPYLGSSVLQLARSRVVWLLVLIVAASLTVNVLALFEQTLAQVVELALFIPLLIGTGGNTGSQAATTVTRALAVGEVRLADATSVVLREARVGMLLGALLGGLAFVPVALLFSPNTAIVISATLLTICSLATLVGASLPLIAKRVGADPAVMSAPFITTLIDASGLVVYFLIARVVLGT